jgi:DNA-binding winged helix-turn-helix (wHTH) protein
VVSPRQRLLLRAGREVPLIPRYLDLLLLLVERRHEAVHRREIFDRVWSDVVVSDGALSQAVRTLRRALGDVSREPAFIRTVSRHGYQFVAAGVSEETDAGPLPAEAAAAEAPPADPFEPALAMLCDARALEEDRREAAERLHALGTAEALARLDGRPGHEEARALLRDARWDVPGATAVPLLGRPGAPRAIGFLVGLRLAHAARLLRGRWAAASLGGALAGLAGGLLGGLVLGSTADGPGTLRVAVPIALVGAAIGGIGAAGVGAGLAAAEALARSSRALGLVALGALGGGATGAIAHLLGRAALEGLFGGNLSFVGGGYEGLVVGAAAGLGYAVATHPASGGMAAPSGAERLRAALVVAAACALSFVGLAHAGGHLGGVSLDFMARSFQGSQVGLAPIAHLLGEGELGPRTRTALAAYEGALFGFGLALGLTRRPRA